MNTIVKSSFSLFFLGGLFTGGYFLLDAIKIENSEDSPILGRLKTNSTVKKINPNTLGAKFSFLLLSIKETENTSAWDKKKEKYSKRESWTTGGFFSDIQKDDPDFINKAKKGCAKAYSTPIPTNEQNSTDNSWDLMVADPKWKEVLLVCNKFS